MAARCLVVALSGMLWMGVAAATPLFAVASPGTGTPGTTEGLYEIDPNTGASTLISPLPFRVWGDIAGHLGDPDSVYAVARESGAEYLNHVSTIDLGSGAVTDLYSFTASDLGYGPTIGLELSGIALDPADSSSAIVLGALIDLSVLSVSMVLFELDLDTGAFSGLQSLTPSGSAGDLTYAPDGSLFTILTTPSQLSPRLTSVDPGSGLLTPISLCPTVPCNLRSIEFDPVTGALYAAGANGDLMILSPATGGLVETIGATGLPPPGFPGGVRGLAFVPEPATGSLLALGLAGLAAGRRRRSR